ncbi:hypothetical protein YC2023_096011 [Brassica napus]
MGKSALKSSKEEGSDLGKLGSSDLLYAFDESPRGAIGEEGRGLRYSNAAISRSNILHRGKELMALVIEDVGGIAIWINRAHECVHAEAMSILRGAGLGKKASYYSEMLLGMWHGYVFSHVISSSLHNDHSIVVDVAKVSRLTMIF